MGADGTPARPGEVRGQAGPGAIRIDVLTIFPDLVGCFFDAGVLGRGHRAGLLDLRAHDLRSVATGPHRSVDDSPFGGGAGMVLMAEPIFATVEAVDPPRPIVLLGPGGRRFDQGVAAEFAATAGFTLVCGRYEGFDERVRRHLVDDELSVGDFVLAGGEVAAMAVIETVARLVPGVLGNRASVEDESFSRGLLEYPQYTRPADYRGWVVPQVLLSGDHGRIARWRHAQALRRTLERRPDLIEARGGLSALEHALLDEFEAEDGPHADGGPPG